MSCPSPRFSFFLLLSICSTFLCANVYARFMAPKDKEKQLYSVVELHVPVINAQTQWKRHEYIFRVFTTSLSGFGRSILRKETRSSGAHRWVRSPRCQDICLRRSTSHTNWQFGHNWTKIQTAHINPLLCCDPSFRGV